MLYLGNAFSVGMLDQEYSVLYVRRITPEAAKSLLRSQEWVSCVGHADTALLFSNLLNTEVPMNRASTSLQFGDQILVGQYNGPRLPEGATSLPEGAKIRWMLIGVEQM
jgi:hypothetical protein